MSTDLLSAPICYTVAGDTKPISVVTVCGTDEGFVAEVLKKDGQVLYHWQTAKYSGDVHRDDIGLFADHTELFVKGKAIDGDWLTMLVAGPSDMYEGRPSVVYV